MTRALIRLLCSMLSVVLMSGCGTLDGPALVSQTSSTYPSPHVNVDWDNPINGRAASSSADAQDSVKFQIYAPKGLGAPVAELVTREEGSVPEDRVVAFLYDDSTFGRVVIEEHLPNVAPDQYDAMNDAFVAMNGQKTTHGSAEIVAIRDGHRGLLTTSEDKKHSTLWWLENGIEIIVRGPTVTSSDVITIANNL